MTKAQPTIEEEIERYHRTGESDPLYSAWSGNFVERANRAHDDLRGALVRAVRRLAEGLTHEPLPEADTVALTRAKVEPMVRGLFTRAEQDAVLAAIEQSVVFLTSSYLLQFRAAAKQVLTAKRSYVTSYSCGHTKGSFRARCNRRNRVLQG